MWQWMKTGWKGEAGRRPRKEPLCTRDLILPKDKNLSWGYPWYEVVLRYKNYDCKEDFMTWRNVCDIMSIFKSRMQSSTHGLVILSERCTDMCVVKRLNARHLDAHGGHRWAGGPWGGAFVFLASLPSFRPYHSLPPSFLLFLSLLHFLLYFPIFV